jgi:hypothetical protein
MDFAETQGAEINKFTGQALGKIGFFTRAYGMVIGGA